MTIRRITLAVAVIALASALQAENIPPRDLWPQAAATAVAGDVNGAIAKTNELITTGKSYGINAFPVYAVAAASLAREADHEKRKQVADWAAKAADQLDARSASVAFSNADRARDRGNWPRALSSAFSGFARLFTNYRTSILSRCDLLVAVAVALALTAAIFSVSLFIRYGRSMAHDFREILGTRIHGGAVSVLAFALLFLPIFLWLSPVWVVLYWFVIFFGYANKTERATIIVLALVLAALPVAVDAVATKMAALENPVMIAELAAHKQSYQPEALRRLDELAALVPDDPLIQLLLGNLQLQEGNEQQAQLRYNRAAELKDSAGVHVNLGNLHFLDNDFAAAMTEYDKAAKMDPNLAIAFYNASVAAGETYKFDEQGQKLEQAKKVDRTYVETLAQNPPSQKIVIYTPPLEEGWRDAERIARRTTEKTLFGTYAFFDPQVSAVNPITIGAAFSAILAVALWARRRKVGFANACIKCGRTFCHRCKSARESATYCTQCIHIYLKRDGVPLATKRTKLEQVHEHHGGMVTRNKIFTTFLPGSAQLIEGRTVVGLLGLFVFLFMVATALLTGRLAPAIGPVADTAKLIAVALAAMLAIVVWFVLSMPIYRRKAVS
jgi:tetratricopeptide (TPR) repeat protein